MLLGFFFRGKHILMSECTSTAGKFYPNDQIGVSAWRDDSTDLKRSWGSTSVVWPAACTFSQDSEQRTQIYIKGCVPQFEKWLQDNLTVVAGIFIGIALLQVRTDMNSCSLLYFGPVFVCLPTYSDLCFVADFWYLFSTEPCQRHWGCEGELVSCNCFIWVII